MSVLELVVRDRAPWDDVPPEYPHRPFEWYVARAEGRLTEYEREHPDTAPVIEPD